VGRKPNSNPLIRHAVPEDYPAITRLFEGPKAIWGTLQVPFPSPELWRKRLAESDPNQVILLACERDDIVGIVGLHPNPGQPRRRHAATIGLTVRDDRHGRGIGTVLLQAILNLADNWMNLTRLELQVCTDNQSAVQLYRKHGFEVEGTLRQFVFRDGQFVDAFTMGRLRPATGPSNS
jgi:L-phenylalanine/L-methionine N-acetyltransferase